MRLLGQGTASHEEFVRHIAILVPMAYFGTHTQHKVLFIKILQVYILVGVEI